MFFVAVFQSVGKWDSVHAAEGKTDNLCQMPVVLFLHAGNMKTVCFLCMMTLFDDSSFYSTF